MDDLRRAGQTDARDGRDGVHVVEPQVLARRELLRGLAGGVDQRRTLAAGLRFQRGDGVIQARPRRRLHDRSECVAVLMHEHLHPMQRVELRFLPVGHSFSIWLDAREEMPPACAS